MTSVQHMHYSPYVKTKKMPWLRRCLGFGLVGGLMCVAGCASQPPLVAEFPAALEASHQHQGRFFNPWEPFEVQYGALLRELFKPNRFAGQEFGPVPRVNPVAGHGQGVRWLGHATMLIGEGDDYVLTDPHLTERALLIKRKTAPALAPEDIPPLLFALISHNHYDHLDEKTVLALPADTPWLVPLGLADWFHERGRHQVQELDWWESVEVGGWTAHCVPVQHWSRRIGQPTNSTLWCGWVLESPQKRYFFGGDTGYFPGFAEIGQRFPNIDVAMLPIGAYYPESFLQYQHMSPDEALQAFTDLGAKVMLPIHWGSFKLTREPVAQPPQALRAAREKRGLNAEQAPVLKLGELWTWPSAGP
nr:MBL fold metallo-hydrolase [Oceanococcus sp. HetDA_MAG_MS8]